MVMGIPYVDQFINEVLRFYPPVSRLDRKLTDDVTLTLDETGHQVHLKKGMVVNIPIYAIHHLEEYYPDPEKFDPDRWSAENKPQMNPYAYLPFSIGPRNCIGMRFALEELKLALCTLVHKFRFICVPETPVIYLYLNSHIAYSKQQKLYFFVKGKTGI